MRNRILAAVLVVVLSGAAPRAPAQTTELRVDLAPGSSAVAFRASGLGLLPLDGEFARFRGMLFYDPGDHAACRVALCVDVASLAMQGESLRDRVLGPDFLDAERFPTLAYDGACGTDGLDGRLTLHGVTRSLALSLDWTPDTVLAVGRLLRADWGMTAMPITAGPTVRIEVSVHLAGARHAGPWSRRCTCEDTMSNTMIETRAGWITDPGAVIAAVQDALREALQLPEWDRTLRLIEHAPSHFAGPPGRGERYTLIEVVMFAGRSLAAKRALYQALVRNLAAVGVSELDVKICLIGVPMENWGIRGGQPASEVDLEFTVAV